MSLPENSALVRHDGAAARPGRPKVPDALLSRPRLLRTLDVGRGRPVTLVCAGAGWVKTSLVASWIRAEPAAALIGWLTIEPQHDDPQTFWSDLLLALGAADAVPLPVCPGDEAFTSWMTRRID